MTLALDIRDLAVPFGNVPGLRGISLQVPAGGRLALVGPSGSGKTSLLRVVAGSARAIAGSVLVGGADVTGLPPDRRSTVLLSQRPLLFPHLSVFENVAFPLRVRNVADPDLTARVGSALEAVGLKGLGARAPSALSGGQAHRVALARAVVARPQVLLLDEPLTSLDPSLRDEVRRAILEVHAEYRTAMILVTHDLEEAGRFADEVAVLLDGTLAQVGIPEEIFRRPRTAALARFLGLPNEVRGVVDEDGWLAVGEWRLGTMSFPDAPALDATAPRLRDVRLIFGAHAARVCRDGERGVPGRVLDILHHPRGTTVRVEVTLAPPDASSAPSGAAATPSGILAAHRSPTIWEVSMDAGCAPHPGTPVRLAVDLSRAHVFPV